MIALKLQRKSAHSQQKKKRVPPPEITDYIEDSICSREAEWVAVEILSICIEIPRRSLHGDTPKKTKQKKDNAFWYYKNVYLGKIPLPMRGVTGEICICAFSYYS